MPRRDDNRTHDRLALIECPVERARGITRLARRRGNLSVPLSRMRTAALVEARFVKGIPGARLARLVGVTRQRVYQLTSAARS